MDARLRQQIDEAVDHAIAHARAGDQVSPETRAQLAQSLATIADRLAPRPVATQLAPAVPGRLDAQPAPPPPATGGSAPPAGDSGAPSTSVTGRAGEVARATLNAIDFPSFVASLIQGTFKAIVDASIQQMQAYAELLKNVAGTVDTFMADNVTEGNAKDYLADEHPSVFTKDTTGGAPVLKVNKNGNAPAELPSFLKDLGFESPQDIDDNSVDEVIVPATRRSIAEQRQQTLSTMVLMGINRVVVDDGEILAKLMFHIDATESTSLKFDQTKTTVGNMAQTAGRSSITAQGLMVNTTNLNAQSDLNVRADLTGQVSVKFRSETFPLERFADSAAIQLINQNAKVPPPAPPPSTSPATTAPATTPTGTATAGAPAAAAAPAAPPAPPAPAAPAVTAQELAAAGADPWAPRRRA
jgi:hypothetical protein